MVKRQDQDSAERGINQGENECQQKASKIGPFTAYEYCRERLSPFGGLLGLVKFLDLVKFEEIFEGFYKPPERLPEMRHYNMVYGILLLLFIGFTRVVERSRELIIRLVKGHPAMDLFLEARSRIRVLVPVPSG